MQISAESSRKKPSALCVLINNLNIVLFLLLPLAVPAVAQTWVEDTFEDFRDGQLDASGQNIYVCRDGTIRTIHRFDLNDDGYIDLLFNSTHDTSAFIPATLATVGPNAEVRISRLAVEGSIQSQAADLNRDGWMDIVFCPNPSGVQHPRRFLTIIWGGPDGWPASRANGWLPVYGAAGIAVADLNGDGWPDIATLNQKAWMPGQPDGRIIRIYWGSGRGYLLTHCRDFGVSNASGIFGADFDGDGAADAAVLKPDGRIQFFWGKKTAGKSGGAPNPAESEGQGQESVETSEVATPAKSPLCLASADLDSDGRPDLIVGSEEMSIWIIKGTARRQWSESEAIGGVRASQVVPSDLDEDGNTDLVITDFSLTRAAGGELGAAEEKKRKGVTILWGGAGGFSPSSSDDIEAPYASAAAVGDLDGDGTKDIAVALYQGETRFAGESHIYFGKGGRRFQPARLGIPTEGAVHVTIAPAEKDLPARVLFSNSQGGTLLEKAPLLLYWGGPKGFNPGNRLEIPHRSGYEGTAADLDADGFVDLVALDSMHAGQLAELDPWAGANIFWGSAKGFDFDAGRTVLRENSLGTSNVADLNKDGYLDVVLGQFANGDKPTEAIIYYGSARGFEPQNRKTLLSEGRSISSLIADFNGDGWLDIAVNSYFKDCLRLFWGSPEGFSDKRQTVLDVPGAIDLETADLNADGRLDLIVCSYMDPVTGNHDTGALIFWGTEGGFRPWNAQRLPALTPLAPVVADFDRDGFLDLFLPAYHGDLRRELIPSYLYWGSAEGFSPSKRTALINDSAADGLAADFDGDGRLDLAVANHTVDGDHHALSKVYYNDGNRFREPRVEMLPTHGPHWMWNEDMGHIADRKFEQRYESSIFAWNKAARGGLLEADARVPAGAGLYCEVRSARSRESLEQQRWRPVEAGRFSLNPDDRYLRYRLVLTSDNGDRYPVVDKIAIKVMD